MIEASIPSDESKRLGSLHKLHLLDTAGEERFGRITRMVCKLLDVPMKPSHWLMNRVSGLN